MGIACAPCVRVTSPFLYAFVCFFFYFYAAKSLFGSRFYQPPSRASLRLFTVSIYISSYFRSKFKFDVEYFFLPLMQFLIFFVILFGEISLGFFFFRFPQIVAIP